MKVSDDEIETDDLEDGVQSSGCSSEVGSDTEDMMVHIPYFLNFDLRIQNSHFFRLKILVYVAMS